MAAYTFLAATDLFEGQRVKIVAGSTTNPPQVTATDDNDAIGTIGYWTPANDAVAVDLYGGHDFKGIANKAIPVGAALFAAAGGKVTDTSNDNPLQAVAITACTADGQTIRYLAVK